MRKDFGAKPFLYPQPVLMIATYGEDGTPDVMNAAWGGIADMKRVAMYLSASHKTVKNILARKAFTVSMADAAAATYRPIRGWLPMRSDGRCPVMRSAVRVKRTARWRCSIL